MASDPLFDTLFRPTAVPAPITSAAPVREAGTRSRAGNAMGRTRSALLEGAARAVEVSGSRISMSQVAAAAGVAKATLYNHFRTRDAVLQALLADQVAQLAGECADLPLAEALAAAAQRLSVHPLLRSLCRLEPALLTRLAAVDPTAAGWRAAREAVLLTLAADGRGGVDVVLRWLSSYVISPGSPAGIAADVEVLLAGLPGRAGGSAGVARPA